MTDDNGARILDAAIKALRTDILPFLESDETRIRFDQITRLLNGVSARLSKRESGLQQLLESAEKVVSVPSLAISEPTLADLENQRVKIEQVIIDQIPELLDKAASGIDGMEVLERVVELEKTFFISQDADVAMGGQVVYRGGRIESEEEPHIGEFTPINEATLTSYVQKRLDRTNIQVVNVRTIPGGFSKHTIFFTLQDDADGSERNLVIRKDMQVPFIQKTVLNEFDLLRHLYELDFPVAKPLWLEDDHAVFGGCFLVSERVAGTSDVAEWSADPIRAKKACEQLAKILARLHRFSPEQLGCSEQLAALSAGELMEKEIAHWTALFHAKKLEPLPLQELPLVWLSRNIPKPLYDRPARIVHGDVGFHNLMFDTQGEVTALLDWEFSVLGDPTQDLCFVRAFVEGIMDWQEFLDLYLSLGGVEPCQEAEFFFSLWSKVRNSIGCVDARAIFDKVMPEEVKFALAGHVFGPYLFVEECESLIAHLKQG